MNTTKLFKTKFLNLIVRPCSSAWLEHQTLNLGVAGSNPVRAMQKLNMEIGLDFDGVISDCGRLKSAAAKIFYGVDLPPERAKKELIIEDGIITLEQYRELQNLIYSKRDLFDLMEAVDGVPEFLPRLQQEGHNVRVVTSRDGEQLDIAKD